MLQKELTCVLSQAGTGPGEDGKTTADMSTRSQCPPRTSPGEGHSPWWDLSLHPLIASMDGRIGSFSYVTVYVP